MVNSCVVCEAPLHLRRAGDFTERCIVCNAPYFAEEPLVRDEMIALLHKYWKYYHCAVVAEEAEPPFTTRRDVAMWNRFLENEV